MEEAANDGADRYRSEDVGGAKRALCVRFGDACDYGVLLGDWHVAGKEAEVEYMEEKGAAREGLCRARF